MSFCNTNLKMVYDIEHRQNNWTVFFRNTINYARLVKVTQPVFSG